MTVRTAAVREISDEEFEAMLLRWGPKLHKFTQNYIPYTDLDDKFQEGCLVLLKCLQRFEEGRGSVFHTYFHRALSNRAGILATRPVQHNGVRVLPLALSEKVKGLTPVEKRARKKEAVRMQDPVHGQYLGELEMRGSGGLETEQGALDTIAALGAPFDPGMEFELESFGFFGLEQAYMMGVVLEISVSETATLYNVNVQELREAAVVAKDRISQLREDQQRYE